MVNHPARSRKTPEAAIKRLLNNQNLHKIEFIAQGDSITAVAHPASWHPLVAARREAAHEAAGDMSLSQARAINEMSLEPVARAKANTFDDAIAQLAAALSSAAQPKVDA